MGEFDKLMRKAFELAEKGLGYTSPNPAVGAIIAKDHRTISDGFHRKAGGPHAEIVAIKKAGGEAYGATLITTLEPCDHFGKTPPCVNAIIEAGIKKVVSPIIDKNPVVNGKGFERLKAAGIDVVVGPLKEYAEEFYRPYFKFITTNKPYVTLKYAQSVDGRIAAGAGSSQWISSPQSLKYSHKLRASNDAILIGAGTLRKDDPLLTTRLVKGTNPIRIILSSSGKIPYDKKLFKDKAAPTYVAFSKLSKIKKTKGVEYLPTENGKDGISLESLLTNLGKIGVMNLLVEGGAGALTSFLKQKQADKIIICIAPMIIGDGIVAIGDLGIKKMADTIKIDNVETISSGPDFIISGRPVW